MLTAQQATQINLAIDSLHSYFPSISILGLILILEILLPKRSLVSRFEYWFVRVRFLCLTLICLVVLSQGIFGGCIIHSFQNMLAEKYLQKEYWWPFGLFGRSYVPYSLWPILRATYIIFSGALVYLTFKYYKKRISGLQVKLN